MNAVDQLNFIINKFNSIQEKVQLSMPQQVPHYLPQLQKEQPRMNRRQSVLSKQYDYQEKESFSPFRPVKILNNDDKLIQNEELQEQHLQQENQRTKINLKPVQQNNKQKLKGQETVIKPKQKELYEYTIKHQREEIAKLKNVIEQQLYDNQVMKQEISRLQSQFRTHK
ncbi:Hypothetical_protein [Hexamita inflata]|uniref:Hypothetical_protein n=1 Tax=Hexamita inflata TaxID=28002 RepID=A0AA86QUY4_9EUKA|nr:Hypothetical protein HINF_LOCUS19864 [Hexamita inflata]CAI9961971.1 Hypothetical protein HINF_LOCUS49616 [Hexamita inflata]